MKSKGKRGAEPVAHIEGIDWRGLLPRCVELIRAIHQPDGDRSWDSDYRQSLYAAVEPLIPAASVAECARAALRMVDAYNAHDGIDPEHDETLTNHAWDALHHVFQWRALIAPLASRDDVLSRLDFAAVLEGASAFPDAWISYESFFIGIANDLRHFDDGEEAVRKAA